MNPPSLRISKRSQLLCAVAIIIVAAIGIDIKRLIALDIRFQVIRLILEIDEGRSIDPFEPRLDRGLIILPLRGYLQPRPAVDADRIAFWLIGIQIISKARAVYRSPFEDRIQRGDLVEEPAIAAIGHLVYRGTVRIILAFAILGRQSNAGENRIVHALDPKLHRFEARKIDGAFFDCPRGGTDPLAARYEARPRNANYHVWLVIDINGIGPYPRNGNLDYRAVIVRIEDIEHIGGIARIGEEVDIAR